MFCARISDTLILTNNQRYPLFISFKYQSFVKPKFHPPNFAIKSADFVADFLLALSQTKFYYSDTNKFIADLSQTLSQPSRHVEMVCVLDFYDFRFGESRRNGIWALCFYVLNLPQC